MMQILYLDNIELGHLKLPHDVLPRVKPFNIVLISKMINYDHVAEESSVAQPSYGRAKVHGTNYVLKLIYLNEY